MAQKPIQFSIPPGTTSVSLLAIPSQEITRLNLNFFPGHRCYDGLFPESGSKAGTIRSLGNVSLSGREIARKTTADPGRSSLEWVRERRERKFPFQKLFKRDGVGDNNAPEKKQKTIQNPTTASR